MPEAETREPAVAGSFYPAMPAALAAAVDQCLAGAPRPSSAPTPKALIVPHAGYVYSGPVAAHAYVELVRAQGRVERVVLLGPAHRIPVAGLATSSAHAFRTPLGDIPLDREALAKVEALPQVQRIDAAHAQEHSLEVQLPFLQRVLGEFRLLPLVVGVATDIAVAEVLDALWGGPETLLVVSTDLSHYHDYATAKRLDAATSRAIERLEPEGLLPDSACGRVPVRGLIVAARRRGLRVEALDLRNSGDTSGPRDRVVGYGAYALR